MEWGIDFVILILGIGNFMGGFWGIGVGISKGNLHCETCDFMVWKGGGVQYMHEAVSKCIFI